MQARNKIYSAETIIVRKYVIKMNTVEIDCDRSLIYSPIKKANSFLRSVAKEIWNSNFVLFSKVLVYVTLLIGRVAGNNS